MRSPSWFGWIISLGFGMVCGLGVDPHSLAGDCEEVPSTPRWLDEVRIQREVWEKTFNDQHQTTEQPKVQRGTTQPYASPPVLRQQPPHQENAPERIDGQRDAVQQRQEWLRQWRDNPHRFSPYATPPWLPLGQWGEDLNYPPWNSPSITPPQPPREWNNTWFFRGF